MKQLVLFLNLAMFFSVNLYCENIDYSMFSDSQQFYAPAKHSTAKHKIHNIVLKKHNGKSTMDPSRNIGYNDEAILSDSKDSACTAPAVAAAAENWIFKVEYKQAGGEIRQYSRDPGTQQRK